MNPDQTLGTCYGFAVRSALPFRYLRSGQGQTIDIAVGPGTPPDSGAESIMEWRATPAHPHEGRILADDGCLRFWTAGWGWVLIDPAAPSIEVPDGPHDVWREEALWGTPIVLCFRARGDFSLHAAAVEIDGGAVVLAAPRMYGKTTLAAAFLSAGFRLLAEDITCVRAGGGPVVVPGPAMLRVRRDIAERLEIRNARPVSEPDDRVHLAVEPELRGDCRPVPLHAIVFLRRSDDGSRTIEPASPTDAVRDLWSLGFQFPTDAERTRSFTELTDLVRSVPIWNFYRPLRLDELPATVDFLAARV